MPIEEDVKVDFAQKALFFIAKELKDPRHDYDR